MEALDPQGPFDRIQPAMEEERIALLTVRFRYLTGLKRELFRNARLMGSWDGVGRFSRRSGAKPQ